MNNDLYFKRDGQPVLTHNVRDIVGGKPYVLRNRACGRCGGSGIYSNFHGKCWDCGGSGKHKNGPEVVRVFSAERLAVLNAAKAVKDAKAAVIAEAKAAKAKAECDARAQDFNTQYGAFLQAAEVYAASDSFIADVVAKGRANNALSDRQVAALEAAIARKQERAQVGRNSGHIGTVGQRMVMPLACTFDAAYDSAFGAFYIIGFQFGDNVVIYKGSSKIASKGEQIVVKATIKEHGERDGVKQTIIARPAVQ